MSNQEGRKEVNDSMPYWATTNIKLRLKSLLFVINVKVKFKVKVIVKDKMHINRILNKLSSAKIGSNKLSFE